MSSLESKSKRVDSAQRAKISRKIREHNRNQRKSDGSLSKKSKKDPGIPNLFPLKDKVLYYLILISDLMSNLIYS